MHDTDSRIRIFIVHVLVMPALWAYFIGMTVAVPYFNWCYARDNGFGKWVLFGGVVASLQAAAWPLYLLDDEPREDWSASALDNFSHFDAAMRSSGEALKLTLGSSMSRPQAAAQIVALNRRAIREAKLVKEATLLKLHPDLPEMFHEKFLPYLELANQIQNGMSGDDPRAFDLAREWGQWFEKHSHDFHWPPHPKP